MKILLMRHGESTGDLTDQFGGWDDDHLTPVGKHQIADAVTEIEKKNLAFEKVLSSPLLRAQGTARIVGNQLHLPVEVFHLVKEFNAYGVFSGLTAREVVELYPEFEGVNVKQDYVPGQERQEDFEERVRLAMKMIVARGEGVIVVAHGGFISNFCRLIIGQEIKKIGDGGWILVDIDDGNWTLFESDNVEFK